MRLRWIMKMILLRIGMTLAILHESVTLDHPNLSRLMFIALQKLMLTPLVCALNVMLRVRVHLWIGIDLA